MQEQNQMPQLNKLSPEDREAYQQQQRKVQLAKNKQFAVSMLTKLRALQITKTEVNNG